MNKPVIISGEASETDSEDELPATKPQMICSQIQGKEISGEDSESETENEGSICSAISALDESNSFAKSETSDKYESLLQRKLRESNSKLHQDVESFCQNIIDEAGRNLTAIDQHLIKSQLTLQNAVTSLKSLGSNSLLIKNKLQSILSADFIPKIKVSK